MIKQTKIWVLIFILSQIYCQSSDLSCCQSLDNTNTICMSCTDGTFLSGNNCIVNINGCSKYSNCFTCQQCATGFRMVDTQIYKRKTKRCEAQPSDVIEVDLANPKSNQSVGQSFLVADDFTRAMHQQAVGFVVVAANVKKGANQKQIITIYYQNPQVNTRENKYFRLVTQFSFETFLLDQKQFKPILKEQIQKSNSIAIPESTQNINKDITLNIANVVATIVSQPDPNIVVRQLAIGAADNQGLVSAVNLIAQGTKQVYRSLEAIRIIGNKNGGNVIQANYTRSDNWIFIVTIQVEKKRVSSIKSFQPTPVAIPVVIPDPIPTNNTTNNTATNTTSNTSQTTTNTTNTTNNTTINPPPPPPPPTPSKQLNSAILRQSGGFTRLTDLQLQTDSAYSIVWAFIKPLEPQKTNQNNFVAAFMRGTGMTRVYKVFFYYNYRTYQAQVNYDRLRKRTVLISFTEIANY